MSRPGDLLGPQHQHEARHDDVVGRGRSCGATSETSNQAVEDDQESRAEDDEGATTDAIGQHNSHEGTDGADQLDQCRVGERLGAETDLGEKPD
jgi:hypothetical protein